MVLLLLCRERFLLLFIFLIERRFAGIRRRWHRMRLNFAGVNRRLIRSWRLVLRTVIDIRIACSWILGRRLRCWRGGRATLLCRTVARL